MLINLKIFSKNKISLVTFKKLISKISANPSLNFNFSIKNLQQVKKRRIFTVLKSPHVNKVAQEQFQYCLMSKKMRFYTLQFLKLVLLIKKLQTRIFPDIKIKTCFLVQNYNLKKFKNQILNPKWYKLKTFKKQARYNRKITNPISLYLKLFDFYGGLAFKTV